MNQIKIIPLITVLAIMLSSCSSPRPVQDFCSQWEIDRALQQVMEGDTYVKNEEYQKCEITYMSALDLFKNCRRPYYEAITYEKIGKLAEYQDNIELALSYYAKASELYHQLNFPNHAARHELEELIAKLKESKNPSLAENKKNGNNSDVNFEKMKLDELLQELRNLENRLQRIIDMRNNGTLKVFND